jgi:N-acyl-D-aspartate/D-glutamate deacylase
MVADQGKAAMSCGGSFAATTIVDVGDYPEFQSYIGRRLGEVAEERGEDPAETVINLSVATDFAFTFQTDLISGPPRMPGDGVAEIMSSPFVLAGASDGGAHAKMFVGGNFGTDMIMWLVRDEKNLSLEEAHFHLSYLPAEVFGLKDRGAIREGAWADIVVYDLEGLQMVPEGTYEKVEDQPGGEWRLIQRCKGISYTLVNGEVTFEDGECTGATPGQLLRKGLSLSPSR